MTLHMTTIFRPTLLAGLVLGACLGASAQSTSEGGHRPEAPAPAHMAPASWDLAPLAEDLRPPILRGLRLSKEQEDKVFSILHAQAPSLREQMKILRKMQLALQALSGSMQYDDAKAGALADAWARAMAESALLHARAEQQIYTLLSAEQRKQWQDAKEKFKARPVSEMHRPDALDLPPRAVHCM